MKTNKLGKILVVALLVMLFALVLTVSVGAESKTVTTADDLIEALRSAQSGDTVTVSSSITLPDNAAITVPANVTLKGSANPLFYVSGKTAEIIVNGTVESDSNFVNLQKNGTLTLNGNNGSVFDLGGRLVAGFYENNDASKLTVSLVGANVTSSIKDANSGLVHFEKKSNTSTCKVTIQNCIVAAEEVALFCTGSLNDAGNVTVEIDNSTVSCLDLINSNAGGNGTVTIKSGNVTAKLAVFSNGGAYKSVVVNVSDGTLNAAYLASDGGKAVAVLNGASALNVSGGTVTVTNVPSVSNLIWNVSGTGKLTLGNFEIPASTEVCVAKNERTGNEYISLKTAIEEATDGDTIILLADTVVDQTISVSKSITVTSHASVNVLGSCMENGRAKTFTVADGVSLTFAGLATYTNCGVHPMATANTVTVTFAGDVKFESGGNYVIAGSGATGGKIVINIKENALLRAAHVVNSSSKNVTFEVTVSGGTLESVANSCIYIENAKYAKITVSGGTFTGVSTALRPVKTHCDIEITAGTFDIKGSMVHGTDFTGTVTVTGDTVVTSCNNAFLIEADEAGVTTALTDTVTVKKNLEETITQAADIVLTVGGNACITSNGNLFQIGGNLHVKVDIVGSATLTCKGARFFYLKDASNNSTNTGEWTVINIGADDGGNAPTLKFAQNFLHFDSVGGNYSYYNLNVSAGVIESTATNGSYYFVCAGDANARVTVTVTGGTFRRAEGVKSTGALVFIASTSNPAVFADVSNATIKDIASFWTDAKCGGDWACNTTLCLSDVNVSGTKTDDFPALFYMKNNGSQLNLTIKGGAFTTTGGIVHINNSNATATVYVFGGSFTSGSHTFTSNPGKINLMVTKGIFNTTDANSYFIFSQFSNAVINVNCDSDDDVQVKGFKRAFSLLYSHGTNPKPGTVTDPLGEVTDGHLFVTVTGGTYEVTDRVFSHTDSGKGVYRISGGKFTAKGGEGFSFYTSASGNSYIYITGGTWNSTLKDINTGMFGSNTSAKQFIEMSGGTYTCTGGPIFGYAAEITASITGGVINSAELVNMNGNAAKMNVTVDGKAKVNLTGYIFHDAPNDNNSHTNIYLKGGTLTAARLYCGNMNGTATVEITGGTYNGSAYVKNENGVCRIGDTYYSTLQAAIDAVSGDTPEAPVTITLVGGLTVDSTVVINKNVIITGNGGDDGTPLLVYGRVTQKSNGVWKTFEIKPGCSVTFAGNVRYLTCGFCLTESAVGQSTAVTFTDSVRVDGVGEVDVTGATSYAFEVNNASAKGSLTLNIGGKAYLGGSHAIRLESGMDITLNISGGTVYSNQYTTVYVNGRDSGTVTLNMSGGTFNGTSAAFQLLNVVTSNVTFTGGTFDIGGDVLLLKKGTHTVSMSGITVKKAGTVLDVQEKGVLQSATLQSFTVQNATNVVFVTGGATLGTAEAPAVLEGITATVTQSIFRSDWSAGTCVIHVKNGTYNITDSKDGRALCSRGINDTVILGTEGGSDKDLVINATVQVIAVHHELHDSATAANRGTYSLTIYNGTFTNTVANLIDMNKGIDGTIVIHGGVFTAKGGNLIDMEGDETKEGTTSIGYNKVDLTVNGGTFTTSKEHFIHVMHYAGTITLNGGTATAAKCGVWTEGSAFGTIALNMAGIDLTANGNHAINLGAVKADNILNISGGRVVSTSHFAIELNENSSNTEVIMTGGYLQGTHIIHNYRQTNGTCTLNVNVSGGTLKSIQSGTIWSNCGTVTVSISGNDTKLLSAGGSAVKATGGSKMIISLMGGSYDVRWRVVEIDNAICDSITVKNITVVNAASVLYYVNGNTKVTRSEVDNVTVADSATYCAGETLFIFNNNGEYGTVVLGNVTVNTVFNNYVTFGSAKPATMTVTGGSAAAKNYVFNITWDVTALDLTVSGGTFSGTRVFHASENPDANRGIEITEATTVRGEGKFNVKITVTGGELSATDRVISAVDGSNVYFRMTGGTITAKNSGSCVFWRSDHTDANNNKTKERAGQGYLYALIEGGSVNSVGYMLNACDAYAYLCIQNAADGTGPVFANASWLVNVCADTANSAKAYVTVEITGGTFTDVNGKGGGICIVSGCTNVEATKPVLDVKISGGSFNYAWELIKLEGGGDVNVTLEGTTNARASRILALWTNATATLNATVTGGTYHGSSFVFQGLKWNTDNKTYADSSFTVSGGTFTSAGDIFNFYDGSLVDINVSGGTFTPGSGKAFMYLCATISNVTVSGGKVTDCGNIFYIIWGDSSKKAGDAKYTDAQVVVYISGDFTANATGYAVYGAQKNSKTVIDISGGTLRAATTLFAAEATAYLPIYITGGKLSALTVAKIATGGAVAVTGLDDANATVNVNGEIAGAHISYVPSEGTKVWTDLTGLGAYAPDNTIATLAGDLTVSGTATISGKLTLTGKGSLTGSVVFFTLADGAELTLDGEITYNGTTNLVQVASGVTGNVSVTFGPGTYVVSSTSKAGALFLDQSLTANTTVNVLEGADIRVGGWGVAFGEARNNDGSGTKTVNMTGGSISGSFGIVFAMGGVQANVRVTGGAITASDSAFYFSNKHFNANGQSNVLSLNVSNVALSAVSNIIYTENDSDLDITMSGIAVNGAKSLLNINSAGTVNATLNDVTATVLKQVLVIVDDNTDNKCNATVIVNGGTYTVTEDSFLVTRYATATVTLKRGTDESEPVITVKKYIGYAHDVKDISYKSTMNWNVTAGVFACEQGIFWYVNDTTGTVTVSGGSFTCTRNEANSAAIGCTSTDGNVTCNISGGSFTSAKTPLFGLQGTLNATLSGGEFNCLYLLNANGTVANLTLTVSGNAEINCDTAVLTDGTAGSKMTLNISGGTVTAPLLQERSFQITCKVSLTGGTLNVRDLTVYGATTDVDVVRNQSTGTAYKTLEDAVNAAGDNDTLVLLTNVIVIRNAITFNGKNLTIVGGTADEPIKVLGIVDNAKYGVRTYATFVVGPNASLTFAGNVEWLEVGVVAEGDNVAVTFGGNVKFDNGKRSDVFYNNNSFADGTVTVTVTENAALLGDWVVYFTGNNAMTSTDKTKTVTMNGGLIEGSYGILFQYVNGVTGNVTLTGGTIRVTGGAIWLDSANVDGKRITVLMEGITVYSNGFGLASQDENLLVDVTVQGNTLIHAGMDASGEGDMCISVQTKENANPSTVNIYGGTFITGTGHCTVQVTSWSAARQNASSEATATKANIYGGYFKASTLGTVRAHSGGYLNIYGGYFLFDAAITHWGNVVRSGTGSGTSTTIGNVYVYGGNFVTKSLGAVFSCVNDVANLTVKTAGVNASGGAYLYDSTNTADRIYYEDGFDHKDGAISMTDGAGVRIVEGSNGLRFVSVVTQETVDYLNSIGATDVKYGTLIAPADIVEQARTFTMADLDAAGLPYLNIEARDGLVARSAGGYYIRAAITNIKESNYSREFAAVGYITYVVNGAEVTIYTSYREPKNARSIEQVARLALRDGDSYSAAQQAILRQFAPETEAPVIDFYLVAGQSNAAGSTQFSDAIASLKPEYTEGYSHIYYSGSSNRARRINVKMKIGYGSQIDSFGAELGIADALSQYYNEETGRYAAIIKYAYGGTSLYDSVSTSNEGNWLPPTWIERYGCKDEQQSGALFRAFINHVESSISDYEAMGYEVNIKSVYWMQGENDISANAKDNLYSEMFRCWIDDVRNSVAEIMCDESYLNLPVIVGEISEYFNGNADETYHKNNLAFVQMQREVIGSWDNVYVISQGNVPTVDWPNDDAHWGYHDHLWNGYMAGSKMLELAHDFYTSVSEEDAVAEVWLDGQLLGVYNSLGGAISMAPEGAVVKLIKDIQMYTTLAIGNRNTITLDGCGHTIDFTPKQYTVGNYAAIKFYNTDITVKDLRVINHSYTEFDASGKETNLATYGAVLKYNAKVTWIGGYLEAERHGFVMNNAGCELTVVSGEFKLRDTAISYASIFFTDAKETKITVEGGSFDAGVGTAYVVYTGSNANGARIVLNGGTFKAGDKASDAIKGLSTTATIIVSEDAVLTGDISNAGLSQ